LPGASASWARSSIASPSTFLPGDAAWMVANPGTPRRCRPDPRAARGLTAARGAVRPL
jgi:hypothetical protein